MDRHGPAAIGWMRTLAFAREKERERITELERKVKDFNKQQRRKEEPATVFAHRGGDLESRP